MCSWNIDKTELLRKILKGFFFKFVRHFWKLKDNPHKEKYLKFVHWSRLFHSALFQIIPFKRRKAQLILKLKHIL